MYLQLLSRKEVRLTNGSLQVSLLYLQLRGKQFKEKMSASQQGCTGRFFNSLEREWLYFQIPKSVAKPTFQSSESTNEEKWNDAGPS